MNVFVRGAYCACTLASASLQVQWDVNCVSIFGFTGNESGLSEGGFWPLGVHIRSRACLLVCGDLVHLPPTSTASCFGLHCGAEATSAMGHRFAGVSD